MRTKKPSQSRLRKHPAPDPGAIYRVPIGASWQKGPPDAEVTIVEWADFQ